MATWKILNFGRVPAGSQEIEFDCPNCGRSAKLPILGRPLAQLAGGIVFDNDHHAMPAEIQCRSCRRRFEAA
jgi:hypothetical protein